MPPEITPESLLPAALVIFFAALVKSTTGFGFALVAVPLLLLLWDPIYVVPVIMPLVFTTDALIVWSNRREMEPKRIAPMVAAGLAGLPIGAYVLTTIPAQHLKIAIAVLVLAAATALLAGVTVNIRREGLASAVAGFFSGVLATSSGLSGPPVTLFMINQQWAKATFRNSLSFYFLFIDLFTMASLAVVGVLNGGTLAVSAALWATVLLGYGLAVRILPRIQQGVFLRVATGIVMGSAIVALANAVR